MSTIMVKLNQIRRSDSDITCIAFVEDSKEPIKMIFHAKDNSFDSDDLPKGYEWCTAHIRHAQINLEALMKNEDVPEHLTVMWY